MSGTIDVLHKISSLQIDHDVCSNYGNWMWTAGVGGDPRGAYRKFNMIKQGLDYDPQVCKIVEVIQIVS